MLDPDALNAFVAVAELGHFVRAADRLGIVQSVVSKRLMRLEDQIGTRLIERGKRNRIVLTRAGELFLPEARAAIQVLERSERLGRQFGRGEAGPVRIGYVFSAIMTGVLPRLIRRARALVPDVDVQLVPMETPEQLAALEDASIDIGIMRPRPAYPAGAVTSTIHSEDIVAALSVRHPLAARPTLNASDVLTDRLIIPQFHEEVGLIDIIRAIARTARGAMPQVIQTTDFITAAGLAAAGAGIAITPRSLTRLHLEDLCYRDIADHSGHLDLVMALRSDLPIALREALVSAEIETGEA